MMAAQSRVDSIQSQIDQVTGQINKASVAVKTAERYILFVFSYPQPSQGGSVVSM